MRTVKFLFPIIFGLILTIELVGGLALASGTAAAPKNPIDTILYVDADANDAATGLSWTDAYTNLQDALTIAISD
jgi:hypothetical protein